jgi:hypothetical protein
MNILFIYTDNDLEGVLNHLNFLEYYDITFCNKYDDFITMCHSLYDMVIVDVSSKFTTKSLEYILNINPKQKLITLFDEIKTCKIINNYDSNEQNFNIIRLQKPINIKSFIETIENFDNQKCMYRNIFDTKETIIKGMEEIIKIFPSAKYNKEKRIINVSDNSNHLSDILEIFDFLKKHEIDHEFQNHNIIKILN